MPQDLEDVRKKLADLGRRDLYFFYKGILGYSKIVNKELHRELCWVVQNEEYRKKLILIPRGMYKTTIATISYSLQKLIRDPSRRIIIACNTMRIAESRLRLIKHHIENNPLFRWLYPEIIPDMTKAKWTTHEIEINRPIQFADPSIIIVGQGSALAGRHCTDFTKDDIVDDKNSASPELIEKVIEWDATTLPIFDVPESGGSEELVIGTPWSHVDLYSLKGQDSDYAVYRRHALENDRGEPDFTSGTAIFPERFPKERLEKIRKRLSNDDLFYCQYMCDPHGGESAEFRREYIQYYENAPNDLEISISVDPGGLADMERSDYTGITIVGIDYSNKWYVLETIKLRLNPREIVDLLFDLYRRYPRTHTIGIETFGWQKSLKFYAQEEMFQRNIMLPIVEFPRDTRISKESRIKGLIPRFSNGGVFLKRTMKDLEDELFKRVINDDLKDSLAYQLMIATRTPVKTIPVIKDPFCIDEILSELSKRNYGASVMLRNHLADEYVQTSLFSNQLEGNA